jgi:hypothetical protein
MIKSSIYQYITIAILVALIFWYMYSIDQLQSKIETYIEKTQLIEIRQNESFLNDLNVNSTLNSISLPSNIYDKLPIKSVNTYLFIYVYPDRDCRKCFLENIFRLKEKLLLFNSENVLILPVYNGTSDNEITLSVELKGLNYMRLDSQDVQFPDKEGERISYFAILTNEGELSSVFSPDASIPEKTDIYFDFIINKYFNK